MQGFKFQVSGKKILTPYVKLNHLLQKCSFILIKLAVCLASGAARMKLQRNGFDFIFFRQDLQD